MKILVQRKQPRLALRAVGYLPRSVRRRLLHRVSLGSWPNVNKPRGYADVATSLLLRRHDLLTVIAGDKDASKTYVRGLTDGLKVPRTRWLGTDLSTIPGSALEGRWVAKLNAGSGAAVAGEGLSDRPELEGFVRSWSTDQAASIFGSTYYESARGGIIIEDYLDGLNTRPVEMKFYCFGGTVAHALIYQYDDEGHQHRCYLDRDGHPTDIQPVISRTRLPVTGDTTQVPAHFDRARDEAEKVATSFPHVRVDLYAVGDELWFGELTPFPTGGLIRFEPASYDAHLANLWLKALHP